MTAGRYITKSDITGVFGAQAVNAWAQTDPAQQEPYPDSRIAEAIDHAEREVESRFRGSLYAVPFEAAAGAQGDGDMPIVRRWMATLAGLWLASTREVEDEQDRLGKLREKVHSGISQVLAHQRTLQLKVLAVNRVPKVVALDKQSTIACDPFHV